MYKVLTFQNWEIDLITVIQLMAEVKTAHQYIKDWTRKLETFSESTDNRFCIPVKQKFWIKVTHSDKMCVS